MAPSYKYSPKNSYQTYSFMLLNEKYNNKTINLMIKQMVNLIN